MRKITETLSSIFLRKKRNYHKNVLIMVVILAILTFLTGCSLPSLGYTNSFDNVYQKLDGKLFVCETDAENLSRISMIRFENDLNCQVSTYYYFDDRHLVQNLSYSVAEVQEGTAVIFIGDQRYDVYIENENSVHLVDSKKNRYDCSTTYSEEQLINSLRMELQSQRAESIFEEYAANKQTAQIEFGNISQWIGYTMKDMLYFVFDPYPTISCEPLEDSTTSFVFTVSGSYYINKADLPQIKYTGKMVAIYDIETKQCTITEGDDILRAMNLYYLFCLNGAQKEAMNGLYGY